MTKGHPEPAESGQDDGGHHNLDGHQSTRAQRAAAPQPGTSRDNTPSLRNPETGCYHALGIGSPCPRAEGGAVDATREARIHTRS